MRRVVGVALALLVVAGLSATFVDYELARFIDNNTYPWMRVIGGWLHEAGKSHWILGATALVSLVAWRRYRDVAHKHLAFFAAVALAGIAAIVLKLIVVRPRPPLFISDALVTPQWLTFQLEWAWNSFPSGHATTGIAIAIVGSKTWPRFRWLCWTLGLAISFGRVLYNVHYLSDVLAGIALGMVVSWWVIQRTAAVPNA